MQQEQGEAGHTFSCRVCHNKLFNDLPAVNKHITLNDFHTRKIEVGSDITNHSKLLWLITVEPPNKGHIETSF